MAKVLAMLPAELADVAGELEPDDELLTADELETVSVFESLKKGPSFARFPGTTLLRRCRPGRVMCSQGDSGSTAFYILTTEDVIELREKQLEALEAITAARAAGDDEEELHQYFTVLSGREIKTRRQEIEDELKTLRHRAASLPPAGGNEAEPARQVATANLLLDLGAERPRQSPLQRLLARLRRGRTARDSELPAYIPVDGPTDIDSRTMRRRSAIAPSTSPI
ncbi:MAG: hypothetical protein KY476_25255, partial [Planctomycetes bacterium]|nr:hypothetical protein [Planctomycetota bacterium]